MIIGSGVDVIEIGRIERVLSERGGRFERRVYTPKEIEDCRRAGRAALHFAVRFAAKEAAMKAVGTGWAQGVRWADIETVPEASSRPRISDRLGVTLHGAVRELANELAERAGGSARMHLAVSRSRTHAMAIVLLEATAP
jgi:holo-[acyl-carrier protein] synthase